MDKKHAGITAVILAILLALVYSQFRMWKNFDWSLFLAQTHSVSKFHILHGIALIYLAYALCAGKFFCGPCVPRPPPRRWWRPRLSVSRGWRCWDGRAN